MQHNKMSKIKISGVGKVVA